MNHQTQRLSAWLLFAALLWSPLLPLAPIATSEATLPPVTNFAKVTVSTGYDSAATSIVLLSGHGAKLPSTFPFPLVWWNATDYASPEDDPFVEIVSVTNRSGDTLTVVRAQESTSAANHNTGGKTYRMVLTLTKSMWDQIRTDILAAYGAATMIHTGTGSPEGVVPADVGEIYLRGDAWSGINVIYQKISGTGNTGWSSRPDLTSPGPIGTTTPDAAEFTMVEATTLTATQLLLARVTPTYGTTVAINPALGNYFVVTATNSTAFQIQNPNTPPTNQLLILTIRNTSGGALGTITWDTLYKMASFTKPANGFSRTVTFVFNGTNWIEINCSPEVPN